jgi:DNA-binding MarR family transcriptional regulator
MASGMIESRRDYGSAARMRTVLRRLNRATEQIAQRHGLTPRRYELLLFVQAAADSGAPATITSLCDPLQTSQSSVTQLVDSAVRAGLLARTPAPNDRRSSHIRLTPLGEERLAAVYDAVGPERERLAAVIGEAFPTS